MNLEPWTLNLGPLSMPKPPPADGRPVATGIAAVFSFVEKVGKGITAEGRTGHLLSFLFFLFSFLSFSLSLSLSFSLTIYLSFYLLLSHIMYTIYFVFSFSWSALLLSYIHIQTHKHTLFSLLVWYNKLVFLLFFSIMVCVSWLDCYPNLLMEQFSYSHLH